jgi:hypothetical protein
MDMSANRAAGRPRDVALKMDGVRSGTMDRPRVGRKLPRRADAAEPQMRRSIVKYAFVGLSARAGATTLAFAFADWLARSERRSKGGAAFFRAKKSGGKKGAVVDESAAFPGGANGGDDNSCGVGSADPCEGVAVVEIGDDELRPAGADYDRVGIDMRFAGRDYVSPYARLAAGASVRCVGNIDGGVNWLLRAPGEPIGGLGIADYVRLSSGATGDVVVIDIGGRFGRARRKDELPKLLNDCDRVFAVIDPLPSALMADTGRLELFKSLESGGADLLYVINKMNPGVDVKELRAFIRVRRAVELPFLAPEHLYAAEYNCCTAYSMPKLAPPLEAAFEQMAL